MPPLIRPAVITDEISQEFEHALDVMLEYGVRDAELRGLWGTNIMELDADQLRRAADALRERGMSVCGIASPLFKCELFPVCQGEDRGPLHLATERSRDEQLGQLERAIEIARYFDTNLIRIFSFWRRGDSTQAIVDAIVTELRPAVRLAEAEGITLGMENEHSCYVGTGEETARLLEALPSPSLRTVWDPGNSFFAGENPFPKGYDAVRSTVAHVHIKDGVRGPEGTPEWVVVGQGEIDYRGQISALLNDGYQGLCSLETHYRPASGDAEEGSRACLAGMLALLREAGALTD